MFKLVFYVPESHKEVVKEAIFQAGAGKIGDYDQCCWEISGTGQFRPLTGANPFLGSQDTLEKVTEYRVETVCDEMFIYAAVDALKAAHPYEEPAYDVWKLYTF